MECELDQDFHKLLKKLKKDNIRLWQTFWNTLELFEKGEIKGKALIRTLSGYYRIVITQDNKNAALYREIERDGKKVAKFFDIGPKPDIYRRNEKKEIPAEE